MVRPKLAYGNYSRSGSLARISTNTANSRRTFSGRCAMPIPRRSAAADKINQIEIFFSILQRKVLTPTDFDSLFALEDRILAFQDRYKEYARPFEWKLTRKDLSKLLTKLALEKAA